MGTFGWVVIGLILTLGVPFTLWWWKEADKWADKEHRRFRTKKEEPQERIVVRNIEVKGGPEKTAANSAAVRNGP